MARKSKILGMKELDAKLSELASDVETAAVRGALRSSLKIAMEAARASVPQGSRTHRTYLGRLVAPGFAARSLRMIVGRPNKGSIRAVLGVRAEAFYAIQFIEKGTAKIPARPWLEPAFASSKDAMVRKYTDFLNRRIRKIARKAGVK
jgi:HK97 gp10 family phage protein